MASIIAVSVFGRIGTHWAPMDLGASDSSGLTDTNSMPASLARAQPCLQRVHAGAARRDLAVLGGKPAERDDQPRVLDDRRPVGHLAGHGLEGADHARQHVHRGAEAVIGDLVDAAAAEEQEPPHQAARMVQPPGRRPTVGAAEDRGVAEFFAHARKLAGDRVERLIPRDFVEAVGAGARLSLPPALADRRPRDAQRRMHHLGDGARACRTAPGRARTARIRPPVRPPPAPCRRPNARAWENERRSLFSPAGWTAARNART